jgi:hypothetical protein
MRWHPSFASLLATTLAAQTPLAYPATLLTTGDHDDHVVPAPSHKFIATLQADLALTRIETMGGHGAGKHTSKVPADRADRWAFLLKNFPHDPPPPTSGKSPSLDSGRPPRHTERPAPT